MIRCFHFFYPFFSWIFQNENVLYLLFSLKPFFYAGLSGNAGYSVFNRIFRSEKFLPASPCRGNKKTRECVAFFDK